MKNLGGCCGGGSSRRSMIAYVGLVLFNNIYLAFCLIVSRNLHNVLSERFARLIIVFIQ